MGSEMCIRDRDKPAVPGTADEVGQANRQGCSVLVRAGPDPTLSVPDFSVPCRAGKRTDPILDPSGPSGHIPGHFVFMLV